MVNPLAVLWSITARPLLKVSPLKSIKNFEVTTYANFSDNHLNLRMIDLNRGVIPLNSLKVFLPSMTNMSGVWAM